MHAEETGAPPRVPDSGFACLAPVARFHGKAAEPAQLAHDFGLAGAFGADDLLRAARRLELKAKLAPLDLARAAEGKLALPCIIELRSRDVDAGAAPVFAVLARVEGDKALLCTIQWKGVRSRLRSTNFSSASPGVRYS